MMFLLTKSRHLCRENSGMVHGAGLVEPILVDVSLASMMGFAELSVTFTAMGVVVMVFPSSGANA